MKQANSTRWEPEAARQYGAGSGSGADATVSQATESGRRLLGGPADLAGHLRWHGPLPDHDGATILDTVERSGLTGRE